MRPLATRARGVVGTPRVNSDGHLVYPYGDVFVPVDPDAQAALHADPGFEDATLTEWNGFWGTIGVASVTSTTDQAMAEQRAVHVELSAAGNQAVMTNTPITVVPGREIEFWVHAVGGSGDATVRGDMLSKASGTPDYFDVDSKQQTGVAQALTGTYGKYVQRFTVPDGHTAVRLSFVVEAPAAADVYLDSSGSRASGSSLVENVMVQALLQSNFNITATAPDDDADSLTDLYDIIDSPSTTAVYRVDLDAVLAFGAAVSTVFELHVDGALQTGSPIVSAAVGQYATAHRVWRLSDLSPGPHEVTMKAYNSGAGTVTASAFNTVLTVTRMQ